MCYFCNHFFGNIPAMNKIKLLLLCVTIALLNACSSTDDNLRAMIPDDAVGVIAIDVPTILSKAQMLHGDTVTIPNELKKLIDDAENTVLGDVLYNLPTSGIDVNSKSYLFFSPGIFKAVALLPLSNDKAATRMVEKITFSKMIDVDGVDISTHLDYAFAIDGNVLFIGRMSNPVDIQVAGSGASAIMGKTKPSLLASDDVARYVDSDSCDMSAYIDVKGMSTILKNNSRLSTIFGYVPALEIITDSDIKAMTATLSFDMAQQGSECLKFNTKFIYDPNGQYSKLYDDLIDSSAGKDAASVLELIPGELDTYIGLKINGSNLATQPAMGKMFEILDSEPLTNGLKYSDILSSIKGILIFGMGKTQMDDYNFAVVTQSQNPEMIVDQIVNLASNRGQSPLKHNGEYIYDYDNQGIAMGQSDNAFYLRCVDFETSFSANELPVMPANIEKDAVAVYRQLKIGETVIGFLNWGLHNKASGSGLYFTANENDNVVISMLKYLCWKEPTPSTDDTDDYDYGF